MREGKGIKRDQVTIRQELEETSTRLLAFLFIKLHCHISVVLNIFILLTIDTPLVKDGTLQQSVHEKRRSGVESHHKHPMRPSQRKGIAHKRMRLFLVQGKVAIVCTPGLTWEFTSPGLRETRCSTVPRSPKNADCVYEWKLAGRVKMGK